MTNETKLEPVYYYCRETTWQSVQRDIVTYATFAAMIGLGVFCNSSAMQWTGALCFFLAIFGRAKGLLKKMTPAEIRADLDRIERENLTRT
jgi:hypothetical protein